MAACAHMLHVDMLHVGIRALRLIYLFTLSLVKAVHAIELASLARPFPSCSTDRFQCLHNSILGQTHTVALHSRFTNCAPNTRVLTSQGSWTEIENIIQAFFSAAGGCSEMSVCFPLATKLPEMYPFYSILTSFNTILIPCLLVLFSPPLGGRNSVKLNLVGSGLKSKFGVNP